MTILIIASVVILSGLLWLDFCFWCWYMIEVASAKKEKEEGNMERSCGMNVKRIPKPIPVHRVLEIKEDEGIMVSACGYRLKTDAFTETTEEITCKACLQYFAGGLVVDEVDK